MNGATRTVERIEVTGIVQGVGFRPFVHRLATELGLDGVVGNDSTSVFIDVAGSVGQLDEFARRLVDDAPPLSLVERVARGPSAVVVEPGFEIAASRRASGARTLVPPDTATCDDCLRELFDPSDRRFRHPFITCTNCGPRFTIIRELPYDRPATTMADFQMCEACAVEYADPSDRRYHAQPIACHDCGPVLESRTGSHTVRDAEVALARTVELLGSGATVAVKGLGGYHLACDATSDAAVGRLRDRKHRPDKPFAIMVADLEGARSVAEIGDVEAAQLTSAARPIVLVRARADTAVSALVAPRNPLVGVMLPSTPVHHLLFDAGLPPLVMTSGNVSGEPIVHLDAEVDERLGALSDGVLSNDRPIHVPCDDSVVRVIDGELLPIRRARGYAPVPVRFDRARRSVLAVGGELKNTCCVSSTDHAWVSQHIGDMEHLPTLQVFEATEASFRTMYDVAPDVVAVDSHPGYATTRWAYRNHPERVVDVQHHHAHVASVMAEHQLDPNDPVIGIAFDGTGYGTDGAIWGGECLVADATGFERVAHLGAVPLPGGDAAIQNPYRSALAHLQAAGVDWTDDLAPVRQLDEIERGLLTRQLTTGFSCVQTTSMGRFFDAVASLLDLRHRISFEAQAAIDLELAADRVASSRPYAFELARDVFSPTPVIRSIVDDLRSGVPVRAIAHGVHVAVADVVVAVARRTSSATGVATVALSGGVFQNALLTEMCTRRLRSAGFETLTHRRVPPNDGGLALGQAFVAAHRIHPSPRSTARLDSTHDSEETD